jgi:hypothetical protein
MPSITAAGSSWRLLDIAPKDRGAKWLRSVMCTEGPKRPLVSGHWKEKNREDDKGSPRTASVHPRAPVQVLHDERRQAPFQLLSPPSDRCSPSTFHNSEQHSPSLSSPPPRIAVLPPWPPREKGNEKSTYVTPPPPVGRESTQRLIDAVAQRRGAGVRFLPRAPRHAHRESSHPPSRR